MPDEIGVGMAPGATRRDILALVLREAGSLVAVGLGIGNVLALGAASFTRSLLFGLTPERPFDDRRRGARPRHGRHRRELPAGAPGGDAGSGQGAEGGVADLDVSPALDGTPVPAVAYEESDMDSIKKTARLAGLLYFLSSLTAPFGLLYVPGKLFVPDDAAATAERIRAFESLMRWGIAANLLGGIVFLFAVLVLYRLFKPVSEKHALAMLVLILLSFPISSVNVLNELAALNLAKGGALSALDPNQRDSLAYLFMWLHDRAYVVVQIFWGLWLFPFGICVIRSGFIPRFLGVLLIIAGAGYPISSFTELVLPQYADAASRVTMILAFGELPIIFWLLIWGARPQPAAARAS